MSPFADLNKCKKMHSHNGALVSEYQCSTELINLCKIMDVGSFLLPVYQHVNANTNASKTEVF